MLSCFFIFLLVECLRKLGPSMNESVEWRLEDEPFESWSDT